MSSGAYAHLPVRGLHHPIHELNLLKRRMNRLADALFYRVPLHDILSSERFPAVNLTEDPTHIYVRAELPGVDAAALDLRVAVRDLVLAGERSIPFEGEGVRYHRRERESGNFSRMIRLPADIDPRRVTANLANGRLTITMAKVASRPRKITVA